MVSRATKFWANDDKYKDLAKKFEEGIEIYHPDSVTSRGAGCGFCYRCGWGASTVKYYRYCGESI